MKKFTSIIILHLLIGSGLILLSSLIGCQTYQTMPIDKESVRIKLKAPNWDEIKMEASKIKHPILKSVEMDLRDGLSPEEASVIAVLVNPSLKAIRDERAIAAGQVIDAGLLPNPQLSYSMDVPTGGSTEGTMNAYGLGVSWDLNDLITRRTRVKAAFITKKSIELDIAWQEWQVAEGAKKAVYDILFLESQDSVARDMEKKLKENLERMTKAYEKEYVTRTDLSETEIALQNIHSQILELQQEIQKQRLLLNRALGVPPETEFKLQPENMNVDTFESPSPGELISGLEARRLDLLALKQGYQSQEVNLHQAVLEQFPKINVGVNGARDTGNVKTTGFGISIDLPFFNRNQGKIAIEKATRKQLFDEYVNRVFESKSDIYEITADIKAIKKQIQYEDESIGKLQKLVNVYKTAVDQQNLEILSYYNAQNDLNEKTRNVIKLRQELQELRIGLEIAAGQYFN